MPLFITVNIGSQSTGFHEGIIETVHLEREQRNEGGFQGNMF